MDINIPAVPSTASFYIKSTDPEAAASKIKIRWLGDLPNYREDFMAVFNSLFMPRVKYSLHRGIAHPVVEAGEDSEPNRASHCGQGSGASPTFIKGLEERRDGGLQRPAKGNTRHLPPAVEGGRLIN